LLSKVFCELAAESLDGVVAIGEDHAWGNADAEHHNHKRSELILHLLEEFLQHLNDPGAHAVAWSRLDG
jgi:hypothetical protein